MEEVERWIGGVTLRDEVRAFMGDAGDCAPLLRPPDRTTTDNWRIKLSSLGVGFALPRSAWLRR
jgi:hypothetical protein